ncbi:non-ribosomal peptide synthase [Pseudomonas sp. MPFS]|nr:non-ribosomal peptide synthase [Pseudomonas sp. MPFS]
MHQNYLIPPFKGPLATLGSVAGLREKWTGAMLDQTGRAYCGALRLDFSAQCDQAQVFDAVAQTLARHPILAARFEIDGEQLVGHAPSEPDLRQALREQLGKVQDALTDQDFLAYRARQASEPGLRIASAVDQDGLHIWIGFWVYTCDGASIDLLLDDIARHYQGQPPVSGTAWNDYCQTQQLAEQTVSAAQQLEVYPHTGPYGLDALRTKSSSGMGRMQSLKFTSNVPRSRVLAYAKAQRVTPFVLLLAIYQRAISAVSGVSTVVTGVPFANRSEAAAQTLVGPLSNTVPVSTRHEPGEPLDAVIKRVQRAVINASARQGIEPAALYPEGMSTRTAGFELPFAQLFNAWNSRSAGSRISLGKEQWMSLQLLPNDTCRVAFEITLDEHTEDISGRIDMDAAAYGDQAGRVIEQIVHDLQGIPRD